MKRQTKQLLCKGAGGNFGQAGQSGCPLPRTESEYIHGMPAVQARVATLTVEMMVKLMGKEDRQGATDAAAGCNAVLPDQFVQAPDRRNVKRDGRRTRGIFRMDDDAAEPGIVPAANHGDIATRCYRCRIMAPQVAGPIGQ